VVRKLGAPQHDEYALGAIADGVRIVDPVSLREAKVTPGQLAAVEQRERDELARRTTSFEPTRRDVRGRTAIVIDDGIATGSTARAACLAQRARGAARIVLATPVAPDSWRPEPAEVDEYICPHREHDFWAVGQFYDDFTQTTDDEVTRLLASAADGS
jgi:putative phosphoribosyl transferase